MVRMKIYKSALFLFLLSAVAGCASFKHGFSDVESMPITEQYKEFRKTRRQLYIQNFDNRTYSPQLTGRLKEKLQFAFMRRQSLAVTPEKDKAELVLYGKILLYTEEPGVYDRSSSPLTYNLTLVASMKLRARAAIETSEGESEEHTVRYTTTYSIGEPLYESRYTAEERLLEGVADRLVSSTYEP
ncbi:MAG: LPS assembly lipoprotein LptE [Turneriella sp.]